MTNSGSKSSFYYLALVINGLKSKYIQPAVEILVARIRPYILFLR